VQTRYQREHVDEDVVVDFHHESVCMYKEQRVNTLHPQPAHNDQLIDVDYTTTTTTTTKTTMTSRTTTTTTTTTTITATNHN